MADCKVLKVGDKCDKCNDGTMRPTGKSSRIEQPSKKGYRPHQKTDVIECDNDNCRHQHANVGINLYIDSGVDVKVKDKP